MTVKHACCDITKIKLHVKLNEAQALCDVISLKIKVEHLQM